MSFSERLRYAINETVYTQADVAKEIDTPLRTLEHWLSGDRVPASYVQDAVIDKINRFNKLKVKMYNSNAEIYNDHGSVTSLLDDYECYDINAYESLEDAVADAQEGLIERVCEALKVSRKAAEFELVVWLGVIAEKIESQF